MSVHRVDPDDVEIMIDGRPVKLSRGAVDTLRDRFARGEFGAATVSGYSFVAEALDPVEDQPTRADYFRALDAAYAARCRRCWGEPAADGHALCNGCVLDVRALREFRALRSAGSLRSTVIGS